MPAIQFSPPDPQNRAANSANPSISGNDPASTGDPAFGNLLSNAVHPAATPAAADGPSAACGDRASVPGDDAPPGPSTTVPLAVDRSARAREKSSSHDDHPAGGLDTITPPALPTSSVAAVNATRAEDALPAPTTVGPEAEGGKKPVQPPGPVPGGAPAELVRSLSPTTPRAPDAANSGGFPAPPDDNAEPATPKRSTGANPPPALIAALHQAAAPAPPQTGQPADRKPQAPAAATSRPREKDPSVTDAGATRDATPPALSTPVISTGVTAPRGVEPRAANPPAKPANGRGSSRTNDASRTPDESAVVENDQTRALPPQVPTTALTGSALPADAGDQVHAPTNRQTGSELAPDKGNNRQPSAKRNQIASVPPAAIPAPATPPHAALQNDNATPADAPLPITTLSESLAATSAPVTPPPAAGTHDSPQPPAIPPSESLPTVTSPNVTPALTGAPAVAQPPVIPLLIAPPPIAAPAPGAPAADALPALDGTAGTVLPSGKRDASPPQTGDTDSAPATSGTPNPAYAVFAAPPASLQIHASASLAGQAAGGPQINVAQVIEQAAYAVHVTHSTGQSLQLQLHPAELGALQVNVWVHDGVLSARLEAQDPATRQILADNLSQLKDSLTQRGVPFEQIDVHLAGSNAGSGGSSTTDWSSGRQQEAEYPWVQSPPPSESDGPVSGKPGLRGPTSRTPLTSLDVMI